MKRTTILYTKLFTKGTLKGLTFEDRISFATVDAAQDWFHKMMKNAEADRLPFRVIASEFQMGGAR